MKLYAWTGVHLSCSLLCYICVAQEINSHSVRKENEMTVSLSLISLCLCVSLPIPLSAFLSPCENLITQQTQGIWQPTVQLLAHIHLFLAHLHGRWKLWRFAAAAPLFLFERGWSPTQHRASALTACFVFLSAGTAQFGPNKSLHSEPHIGTIRELVNASVKKKKNKNKTTTKQFGSLLRSVKTCWGNLCCWKGWLVTYKNNHHRLFSDVLMTSDFKM